jgi:phosphomevalonate kinase
MENAKDLASQLQLPTHVVDAARENAAAGRIMLLAASGKLGSGKDTIALEAMRSLGHADALNLKFADALKDEVDQVVAVMVEGGPDVLARIAELQDLTLEEAATIADMLAPEVAQRPTLSTHTDRSAGVRAALQHWGTEIRRSRDPQYWTRKAMSRAVSLAAAGHSVYITDARFPNEIEWSSAAGFTTMRLYITPETQQARLGDRGDRTVDPAATAHASETALDGYTGFDLVIDNNGPLEETMKAVLAALAERGITPAVTVPRPVRVSAGALGAPGTGRP